jgi:hypothetical protein
VKAAEVWPQRANAALYVLPPLLRWLGVRLHAVDAGGQPVDRHRRPQVQLDQPLPQPVGRYGLGILESLRDSRLPEKLLQQWRYDSRC